MNFIDKFSNWLISLIRSKYFTGVLPDTRTVSEVQQDYNHAERAPVQTSDPFGNVQIATSPYPYVNQFNTSSCVTHAATLAYGIERVLTGKEFEQLSPAFVYRLRSNYAGEGSIPANIYDILHKTGAPLFTTLPTPQDEVTANNVTLTQEMYQEGNIYKGGSYFKITPANDINTIAAVAQQGHAVNLCLFATFDEYAQQYPQILQPTLTQGNAEVQHEITVLPYSGFIKNGVKYVAIQDSAWFGGWKLRYLSEQFIQTRVTESRYWVGTLTLATGTAPKHVFTQNLSVGATGTEVTFLQQLLISEGLLPTDCATGYFGGYTLAGTKAFQAKYAADILLPNGLLAPTGFWGPASIKKANQICA